MNHNFFYKKIGTINDTLLTDLISAVPQINYSPCKDFSDKVITISNSIPPNIFKSIIIELSTFFHISGHIESNIARMCPMSYVKEHSDLMTELGNSERINNIIKLQIPIITNEKSLMMWAPTKDDFCITHFELGNIYIIDNVKTHSAINGGTEYRYYLTSRFRSDSLKDIKIIE